jgi:uncharacterized metal-binding protein YceD (DUF177 family)
MTQAIPGVTTVMPSPEFSRPVALARLGAELFRQDIAANAAERAALARRFDIVALDRLTATVELVRRGKDRFVLHAAFEADFVQSCAVTLDPVIGAASEEFTLVYGPPEAEAELSGTAEDDVAFEPIVGTVIDVGEAVSQQVALALPPFPRIPGASVETEAPPAHDPGPFGAALSRLVERHDE